VGIRKKKPQAVRREISTGSVSAIGSTSFESSLKINSTIVTDGQKKVPVSILNHRSPDDPATPHSRWTTVFFVKQIS
jgi:hypothetical protein